MTHHSTFASAQTEPQTLNILLVEDDDADAKTVIRAFQKSKIANPITRVTDGFEAMELLTGEENPFKGQPVILLVDVNMPRMSGHEFVHALRQRPQLNRLVVFMLSTSALDEDINAAYDNNVAGYILKKNACTDVLNFVETLDNYWKLVELPKNW